MKTEKQNITTSNITLQIRIGVTGHRYIKDAPLLNEQIRKAFTEKIQNILKINNKKNVTPISYIIVTPLADGADRIVAVEAMQVLNAQMEVVLPMQKEEYEQTFLSKDSILEFESLLKQVSSVETLLDRPLSELFPEKELNESRHYAYQKVGRHIVDHCDILIALWNGNDSNNKGGTAEIVNYARSIKRTIINVSSVEPHKISIEAGDDFIRKSLESFEFFNHFKITDTEQKIYINNYSKSLFDNAEGQKLNKANIDLIKENLLPFYVRTSKIAKKYQNIYQKSGLAVYLLAPLAVTSVACGILIHNFSLLFFPLEFMMLISIILIIYLSNKVNSHKKWIHYRYLTEQIRTALFFVVCGFKPLSIKIASHLRVAHKPNDWMVRLFDEILKRIDVIPLYKEDNYLILLNFIKEHWLKDQLSFHKKKWESSISISRSFEIYGGYIFAFALLTAAIHILFVITGYEYHYKWISDYIILAAISLPAFGASIGAIRNHREYSRIGKRSENIYNLLKELLEECDNVKSMDDLTSILNKLKEEILHESQDWLMLMKFVKVEAI